MSVSLLLGGKLKGCCVVRVGFLGSLSICACSELFQPLGDRVRVAVPSLAKKAGGHKLDREQSVGLPTTDALRYMQRRCCGVTYLYSFLGPRVVSFFFLAKVLCLWLGDSFLGVSQHRLLHFLALTRPKIVSGVSACCVCYGDSS